MLNKQCFIDARNFFLVLFNLVIINATVDGNRTPLIYSSEVNILYFMYNVGTINSLVLSDFCAND